MKHIGERRGEGESNYLAFAETVYSRPGISPIQSHKFAQESRADNREIETVSVQTAADGVLSLKSKRGIAAVRK